MRENFVNGYTGCPGAAAQELGVLGHNHGQLVVGVGAFKAGGQIPGVELTADLLDLAGLRILPAQIDRCDATVRPRLEIQRIQSGGVVPGPQFAGIHGIVPEILVGDCSILITNQAVTSHDLRVEIDLHFGILGDCLQGAG